MNSINSQWWWTQDGTAEDLRRVTTPTEPALYPRTLPGLGTPAWADAMQPIKISPLWAALSVASSAVSAYHGYKRNNSVGWAALWALAGGILPGFVPVIAIAQGFGKKKR